MIRPAAPQTLHAPRGNRREITVEITALTKLTYVKNGLLNAFFTYLVVFDAAVSDLQTLTAKM
jgi:hypothetical protein